MGETAREMLSISPSILSTSSRSSRSIPSLFSPLPPPSLHSTMTTIPTHSLVTIAVVTVIITIRLIMVLLTAYPHTLLSLSSHHTAVRLPQPLRCHPQPFHTIPSDHTINSIINHSLAHLLEPYPLPQPSFLPLLPSPSVHSAPIYSLPCSPPTIQPIGPHSSFSPP